MALAEQLIPKIYNEGSGVVETVNSGTSLAISDPSTASVSAITLNGATPALTLPAPRAGARKMLFLIQDATGSRVPTWATASGTIKWVGSAAPTLSTAAGKIDRVEFYSYNGSTWIGQAALNIG